MAGKIPEYRNDHFSQKIKQINGQLRLCLESTDVSRINLNHRIFPEAINLNQLPSGVREPISTLFKRSLTLRDFFSQMVLFTRENIEYSDIDSPQDYMSVFRSQRANCIGLANVTKFLLDKIKIKSRTVRGFYLKPKGAARLNPQPHRWLEIFLKDGSRFFFDPQYPAFSANYIKTNQDINFGAVIRFESTLFRVQKKIKY